MPNSILVMLEHTRLALVVEQLETAIQHNFSLRHEYPLWPIHGENPVDTYEEMYHGPMRHIYYRSTIQLVRTLKALRTVI